MIDRLNKHLSLTRHCQLLGLSRSSTKPLALLSALSAGNRQHGRPGASWRLSNTMDATFCVEALKEALAIHGRPEVFNSDQGAQFTRMAFTGVLEAAGVRISMDGKGRCMDNVFVERLWLWRSVKYEEIVCCERFVSA